jgi:hypothetical protein
MTRYDKLISYIEFKALQAKLYVIRFIRRFSDCTTQTLHHNVICVNFGLHLSHYKNIN